MASPPPRDRDPRCAPPARRSRVPTPLNSRITRELDRQLEKPRSQDTERSGRSPRSPPPEGTEVAGPRSPDGHGCPRVDRPLTPLPRALPARRPTTARPGRPRGAAARTTVPFSASRSPTTSMFGILRSSASRILRPIDSVRSSMSTRNSPARSATDARVLDVASVTGRRSPVRARARPGTRQRSARSACR